MARLKNRQQQIPNGFKFYQPETKWSAPPWASFDTIVKALIDHRKGNPFLAQKHRWSSDYNSVANEVDTYNAKICQSHGWHDFILSEAASFPKTTPLYSPRAGAVAGPGKLRRTAAGVKTVMEWLGNGLRPVPNEQANARAVVCVACPKNKPESGLFATMTQMAIDNVRALVEIKNEMALTTPLDAELQSCEACGCVNRLKVWVPIEHILKGQAPEERAKLDPKCWVLAESAK